MAKLAGNMNIAEIQVTRNYSPPNKVKEIRNAYELRGDDKTLYYNEKNCRYPGVTAKRTTPQ